MLLAVTSVGVAQTRSASPDTIVKNLYAAHNAKRSPFFQTRSRARVDQHFTKKLADMIWKDAIESKGEIGALGADPLYNAQDTRITVFKVGKPMYGEGNRDIADVEVSFKNFGAPRVVLFRLERVVRKWKIDNISYPADGFSLVDLFNGTAVALTDIEGQLNKGETGSYILYVGKETGDYAAYCFVNDSDVGRSILAICKDGDQCSVKGEVTDDTACKAPGLEADLSARGRILKVSTVKSRGKKK